jgi:hydroxysqualene synthase
MPSVSMASIPPRPPAPRSHYENFPVASVLCPAHLRPAIAAIYWFARTADDIADEGPATPQERLADLAAYREELGRAAQPEELEASRWPHVFVPLRAAIRQYRLPPALLADLLDAFAQDIAKTAAGAGYADRAELLDYCRRSANPVGRLLLHLYGIDTPQALAQSDAICTALQLINFWQDPSVDLPRKRRYFTDADCAAFGVDAADLMALRHSTNATYLIANYVIWSRATMQKGAPLVHRIPGRAGWELRFVVQGGLRILDKIEAMGFRTIERRPVLRAWDWAVIAFRVLRM